MIFDTTKQTVQEALGISNTWVDELQEVCDEAYDRTHGNIRAMVTAISPMLDTPNKAFIAGLFLMEHYTVEEEEPAPSIH